MRRGIVAPLAALTLLTTSSGLSALGCGGAQRPPLPPGACSPAPEGDVSRPWEHRAYAMRVPLYAPRRGATRPRVVIQAFSDFECPYCARAAPTLDRVIEDYGACVQIVWRNYPQSYHAHAELAAEAAMEVFRQAGDDAFWRYHDRLFRDQEHIARADLEAHARALGGIDMEAFGAALDERAQRHVIERDLATPRGMDLTIGTPSFFVNGRLIHGARGYEHFQREIELALRETLTP